jgi:hypothetical protein
VNTFKRWAPIAVALCLLGTAVRLVSAQGANGISSPRDNAEVSGQVVIQGTATDPQFLRYELAFFKEFDPLGDWVVFYTGDRPVVNGVLATWDTTVGRDAGTPFYPDGTYRLRLRVVHQDGNYGEYYVLGLSLANEEPTPVPAETPGPGGEATASAVPTSALLIPTELPTLTPFPTATPRPTAIPGAAAGEDQGPPAGESRPLLSIEGEFDAARIRGGLLTGIKLAILFFVLLAAYVLLRTGLRFVLTRAGGSDLPGRLRDWLDR